MIFNRFHVDKINWVTSSFLIGTFVLTVTAVPTYLWFFGISWFQLVMFVVMFYATGMSITLGYHRLFSHMTFQAKWPVKLFTLLFGAAAFENSVIMWASEHRMHHKHVDHDDDPYAISKGFFFAHIGWLLFKLNAEDETPPGPTYVSIWTTHDDVVVPPSSASLDGALNMTVQSVCPSDPVRHSGLPTDADVQAMVRDELRPGRPVPLTTADCPAS